jgi:hypothetical protein
MRKDKEFRQLADNARRRASQEGFPQFRSEWELLAATYLRLAEQSVARSATFEELLKRQE